MFFERWSTTFREVRKNPSVTLFGPFGFWCSLHTAIVLWLFLNKDCRLHEDLANERLLSPLVTLAFLLLTAFTYLWALGSVPKHFDSQQEEDAIGGDEEEGNQEGEGLLSETESEGASTRVQRQHRQHQQQQHQSDLLLPLRAKYCKRCKACVLRHDHHCPFFGGCIGLGNHRTFYLFLAVQTGLCAYAAELNSQCYRKETAGKSWVADNGLPILVTIVISLALLVLVPLFLTHTYLILKNKTTYELLAREKIWYLEAYGSDVNPFDRGWYENAKIFFRGEVEHTMPSSEELEQRLGKETIWDNSYYSCC